MAIITHESIIREARPCGQAYVLDTRLYVFDSPGRDKPGAALSVLTYGHGSIRLGKRLVIPRHELIGVTVQDLADEVRQAMRDHRLNAALR